MLNDVMSTPTCWGSHAQVKLLRELRDLELLVLGRGAAPHAPHAIRMTKTKGRAGLLDLIAIH
jgi:hypothetical protein